MRKSVYMYATTDIPKEPEFCAAAPTNFDRSGVRLGLNSRLTAEPSWAETVSVKGSRNVMRM